jgi:hypothetical protein
MAAVMPLAARAQQHFKIGLLDTGVDYFVGQILV